MRIFCLVLKLVKAIKENQSVNIKYASNIIKKLRFTSHNHSNRVNQKICAEIILTIGLIR